MTDGEWIYSKYFSLGISPQTDQRDVGQQEEGNENMEKKFAVTTPGTLKYKTYEDAEKEAKRYTATNGSEYVITQAIATTVQPVPEIEVVKL